jgi:hypothetical protein
MRRRTAASAGPPDAAADPPAPVPRRRRGLPPLVTHLLVAAPILTALLVVLVGGYVLHWSWTGYRGQEGTRKLWDWLEMSVLPLTLALLPVWLQSRDRHRRRWVVAESLAGATLGVLVTGGYLLGWTWTGFTGNTLWDWLGLFLVPFVLPVVFHLLADRQPSGRDLPPGVAEPRRPPGDQSAVVWAGGVAAVACVVLVALLVTGLVTRDDGGPARAGPRPVATASAGAVVRSLTVDGRDPLWTATGLAVHPGDRVDISAFGLVRPSRRPGYHAVPPSGLTTPHPGQLSIAARVNHEALVATIGEASTPGALGGTSPTRVLAVGADRTLAIRESGELFLGVNDRLTADNSGWFGATVTLRHRR